LQNAEFWPGEAGNYPKSTQSIVTPAANGGAGFDVAQHDDLRIAVRGAVQAASFSARTPPLFQRGESPSAGIRPLLANVPCVENHDIVKVGTNQRIPTRADGTIHRSWYARSRSRFATGILLTAPGIPQPFMGQEFLEDKQWSCAPKKIAEPELVVGPEFGNRTCHGESSALHEGSDSPATVVATLTETIWYNYASDFHSPANDAKFSTAMSTTIG
jgi:1,4-alpha-glucan branching enzyme